MRVLVTGCRHWRCYAVAHRVCSRLAARYGSADVVHGSAPGVDSTFHEAAIALGLGVYPFPADWQAHGKGAGPKRNQAMVDAGADLCLAVHRDLAASKGTRDCARRALAAGIPVWLIDSDDAEPRRLTAEDLA